MYNILVITQALVLYLIFQVLHALGHCAYISGKALVRLCYNLHTSTHIYNKVTAIVATTM